MTETIQYVATCLFGLESLLGAEIDKLGYRRLDTMDGRVTFEGDRAAVARCNVGLRYAERLYVRIGGFRATTFDDLFEGTKALPWEQYIGANDAFPVRGHSIKSTLFSVPDCQSIIKKAIVSRLGAKYGIRWFEETGVKYQIDFFLFKDEITLMIDTSGTPLHKRGYRPLANAAPLRETLAAAVAALARPREDVLFWDPFCGSGTIAVEAAMMMTNRAPGMNRYFDAERFPAFGKELFNEAREEAKDLVIRDSKFEVYASDIDPECVHIAIESAKHAGVYEQMKIFRADALTIKTGGRRGTVVCNPPYGERMMTLREAENLYRKMGEHFKTLDRWQIYVLTSHDRFGNVYGRRPDKVRKLYNGMIPCYFYQFFKNDKV
ncbi:MAG: class I SAM-dependent RNA methyltransferase [Clostridia bacterium]|nr:class I SAM-dependent RNA methyltransferase [Clostridia bacterium]